MSKKIIIYYIFVASILGIKLVSTLFQGSMVAYHSQQIHTLTITHKQLVAQKLSLQAQISSQQSLVALQDGLQSADYLAISNPILVVSAPTTLAEVL
jgi:hypothetical protein